MNPESKETRRHGLQDMELSQGQEGRWDHRGGPSILN